MYKLSEASIQLIDAQSTSLSCTCINGAKRVLGLWQPTTSACKGDAGANKSKHYISSLFLSECAQNLQNKMIASKQQAPLRHRDRPNNKQEEVSHLHQFTHESSVEDHIISYRNKKNLKSTESGDEIERQNDLTNPLCSAWISKEKIM